MYSFREFIEKNNKIPSSHKEKVLSSLAEFEHTRIIGLILILLVWSALSAVVESTLIGGGVLSSLIHGTVSLKFFLPELAFLAVNFIAKIIFIPLYMAGNIGAVHIFYGAIPSVGPVILANIFIRKNKFLFQSLRKYALYRRRDFFAHFSFKKIFSNIYKS